jgi:alkanesulfonate monooxygenase SsuD/methylene tetrahydromethanopterin reductase-like flavin-dependent oxidoreductase (luciferase family)
VRFSIYSEMQLWPGKSPERLYAEVEEQIVHADRLGYDAYAIVEHFFFPKFSISPDPLAIFAQVAPRTQQIRFRTMLHVLPFHNPTVLASRIAAAQILTGGRYEFGVGRGHGWAPPKAGVRLEDVRELYDESFEVFFKALENERFSHDGRFYQVHDSHLAPPPPPAGTRVFVGGTSDSTYELAGRRGWAVAARPARHLPPDLRRPRESA